MPCLATLVKMGLNGRLRLMQHQEYIYYLPLEQLQKNKKVIIKMKKRLQTDKFYALRHLIDKISVFY